MHITIKEALKGSHKDQEISVQGWVRTTRAQKSFAFVEVSDGTCLANLQLILNSDLPSYLATVDNLTIGSSIEAKGKLVANPNKPNVMELQVESLTIVGSSSAEAYPLQKKRHSFEFLRTIAHLRPRTNSLGAVFRIRSALYHATQRFFDERGFFHVATPIITAADCEGAGELFTIEGGAAGEHFFGKPAHLTVSGQLNAEAFALGMSRVYTFGPTFRAENSNTARHLAEFWMLEPEVAFCTLEGNMDLAEAYLKAMFTHVLENCPEDLALFDKFICPGLLLRLELAVKEPFERITYTEAIEILQASGEKFEYAPVWEQGLQTEHERYLCEKHFKKPCIVFDYPKEIKAFYMRLNEDGKTVAAMDVLLPQVGEIAGGSQREERLDVLEERMQAFGIAPEELSWYLDLRRYGSVPHSGFGIGFERLVLYATGMENIRDVIPFPRTPGHVSF